MYENPAATLLVEIVLKLISLSRVLGSGIPPIIEADKGKGTWQMKHKFCKVYQDEDWSKGKWGI